MGNFILTVLAIVIIIFLIIALIFMSVFMIGAIIEWVKDIFNGNDIL